MHYPKEIHLAFFLQRRTSNNRQHETQRSQATSTIYADNSVSAEISSLREKHKLSTWKYADIR